MFTKDEIPLLCAALETYDDFTQRESDQPELHKHIQQLIPKIDNYCAMTYLTKSEFKTLLFSIKYVIDISEATNTYIGEEYYLLFDKIYNIFDSE